MLVCISAKRSVYTRFWQVQAGSWILGILAYNTWAVLLLFLASAHETG
jgi:hypothetical protein